jgi:hypothetical protein
LGGWMPASVAKAGWLAMRRGWSAAGAASAQLSEAVDRKALENEGAVAVATRAELEEAIPEAPKRSRGPSRL